MTTTTPEPLVFPGADVEVQITQEDGKLGTIMCSSYALMMASPVWKNFLFPPWEIDTSTEPIISSSSSVTSSTPSNTSQNESTTTLASSINTPPSPKAEGKKPSKSIDCTEDNLPALKILLNIAHLQFWDVPTEALEYQLLYDIAILIDQYQCISLIRPWLETWLEKEMDIANTCGNTGMLFISWAFGRENIFEFSARKLVDEYQRSGHNSSSSYPIPDLLPEGIIKSVRKTRADTIEKLLNIPYSIVDKYEAAFAANAAAEAEKAALVSDGKTSDEKEKGKANETTSEDPVSKPKDGEVKTTTLASEHPDEDSDEEDQEQDTAETSQAPEEQVQTTTTNISSEEPAPQVPDGEAQETSTASEEPAPQTSTEETQVTTTDPSIQAPVAPTSETQTHFPTPESETPVPVPETEIQAPAVVSEVETQVAAHLNDSSAQEQTPVSEEQLPAPNPEVTTEAEITAQVPQILDADAEVQTQNTNTVLETTAQTSDEQTQSEPPAEAETDTSPSLDVRPAATETPSKPAPKPKVTVCIHNNEACDQKVYSSLISALSSTQERKSYPLLWPRASIDSIRCSLWRVTKVVRGLEVGHLATEYQGENIYDAEGKLVVSRSEKDHGSCGFDRDVVRAEAESLTGDHIPDPVLESHRVHMRVQKEALTKKWR